MRQRNWLIYEDSLQDPAVRIVFDHALALVQEGGARPRGLNGDYPLGFVVDGKKLLGVSVLEYALERMPIAEFNAEAAQAFAEQMRAALGWDEIDFTLHTWIEKQLCTPYFENQGSDWNKVWVRKPQTDPKAVPDAVFRFACYVALCDLKFGPSYASVKANEIFDWVTQLGSDLPARLKKHGTGELPAELAEYRAPGLTATANDALAVIRVTITQEQEQVYGQALDYLVRLLTTTNFPRSYALEFRGPTKTYLPIKGLPKKGVHQLFACAAAYPALHASIAAYARAAMREFCWYQNLDDEDCAMPGSFAVFAIALADESHAALTLEYLRTVDGEHQSMHGRFVEAYVEAHGFTATALAYLIACAGNLQELPHRKHYAALMANQASLECLLQARTRAQHDAPSAIAALRASLAGDAVDEAAFRAVREVIWGDAAGRDQGRRIIAAAPQALRPLYEQIFAETASAGTDAAH